MWIDLPNLWIALLNCLGIPAVHLLASWWATSLPADRFRPDGRLHRIRRWEKKRAFYEQGLRIRSWKHLLPDAAPWFGGFSKGHLESNDSAYLRHFAAESCRGEFSHWIQFCVLWIFILWNPFPANLVIIAYSLIMNLPCIMNLRYTRQRLIRILEKRQ